MLCFWFLFSGVQIADVAEDSSTALCEDSCTFADDGQCDEPGVVRRSRSHCNVHVITISFFISYDISSLDMFSDMPQISVRYPTLKS